MPATPSAPGQGDPSSGLRDTSSRLILLAVVLAVAVAGCLGPPGDGDGGDEPGEDHAPIRLSQAGLTLEGCADGARGNASTSPGSRGAGWGDYDGDGDEDLYVACDGPNRLYEIEDGQATEVAADVGVAGSANSWGVAWGDADGDGCLDLYVANAGDLSHPGGGEANDLYRNTCNGTFERVPEAGGASHAEDHSTSAAWADHDRDGDLDLYVANRGIETDDGTVLGQRNRLYENRNGSFEDVAPEAGVAGAPAGGSGDAAERRGATMAVAWLDYNTDGRPDLYAADGVAVSPLYRNLGNGSFEDVTEEAGLDAPGRDRGVAVGDLDGDEDLDLFVARRGEDVLWENLQEDPQRAGTFREAAAEAGLADGGPGAGASLVDLDADGDEDLYVARGNGSPVRDLVHRNDGDGTFTEVGDAALHGPPARSLATAVADADGDGDRDVYVTARNGSSRLQANGGPQGSWIGLALEGNRSTTRGIGALVYVVTDNETHMRDVQPGTGFLSSDEGTVYVGLEDAQVVDTVEIFWPSGIRQVIHEVEPVNQTVDVAEEQTIKTSCPLLFGWTGDGFAFRSDVLGNAYVGWRLSPDGYHMVPDPTERIRFDGLEPRDGAYEIRLMEALEEINYLDEVELTAVDHPADVEVLPNETFAVRPPHDDLGLVQAQDPEPVVGAWMDGRNVTDLVVEKDGESPDVPRRPAPTFDGYAHEHSLTLDLGDRVADAETVQLLVDGWTYYPMVVPDRAVEGPWVPMDPPSVEALDPATGEWVPVEDSIGVPAGLPKQMTVNLTGELPDGAQTIRLTTNLQVHWDRIRVDTTPDEAPVEVTSLDPDEATLHRTGYPIFESEGPQEPGSYDYRRTADHHVWDTPTGNYTRLGDVTPLLQAADDKFTIFRHGDEVRIRFPADAFPELRDGWERTLFVDLDGFFKDMEEHNAYPETVEPLPYHGMENYPPEEPYPDDEEHREYRETWNTRHLGEDAPAVVR